MTEGGRVDFTNAAGRLAVIAPGITTERDYAEASSLVRQLDELLHPIDVEERRTRQLRLAARTREHRNQIRRLQNVVQEQRVALTRLMAPTLRLTISKSIVKLVDQDRAPLGLRGQRFFQRLLGNGQ